MCDSNNERAVLRCFIFGGLLGLAEFLPKIIILYENVFSLYSLIVYLSHLSKTINNRS